MDMLVPVDEIGQSAEGAGESVDLRRDFQFQRAAVEPAGKRRELHGLSSARSGRRVWA